MEFQEIKKKPERYPAVIACRCSKEEHDQAHEKAKQVGLTLSEYVRKRLNGSRVNKPIQDRHDLSQLRQHFGLLKKLMGTCPTAKNELNIIYEEISALIAKMSNKIEG